ncbi:PPOX class F420-dependent oxidoreductase [Sciscionella sediminilitoris]|uniref:PPOX class F420-dependent oxidoreductase n=1 Tax=Sciscionella sediminilitoris TaxID=1445613 RepID=UPI0004DED9D3|nr:PPOX class F420-dependent oxidoreductase [Sciscionella sp. SE31]
MTATFDEPTRALLDGLIFPSVATLGPDGAPRSSVVWARREGDTIVFVTRRDARKGRDLARDPRISLAVTDAGNPYRAVEIRGTAELTEHGAGRLIGELAHRYLGADSPDDGSVRVIVRIIPEKVVKFGF